MLYKIFKLYAAAVFFVFGLFFGTVLAGHLITLTGVSIDYNYARLVQFLIGALIGLFCYLFYKTMAVLITSLTGGFLISSGICLIADIVSFKNELKERI